MNGPGHICVKNIIHSNKYKFMDNNKVDIQIPTLPGLSIIY